MKLQRKNRARALTLGALALSGALALTACGSDETGDTTGGGNEASASAADVECGKGGQLLASGSSAQKNAMDVWIKNYRAACPDTQINYKPDGSGSRRHRLPPGPDRLRGLGLGAQARGDRAVRRGLQGQPGHRPADGRRPDRDRLQRPRRRQAEPGRGHPRGHLQRQDHHLGRRGDQEAQPGRRAARHQDPGVPPLRRVGHHRQLHQVPQGRRAQELAVRAGQGVGGQGRPVRAGLLGRRPAGEADRRAPSRTSSSPTPPTASRPSTWTPAPAPRSRPPSTTPRRPSPRPRSSARARTSPWSWRTTPRPRAPTRSLW